MAQERKEGLENTPTVVIIDDIYLPYKMLTECLVKNGFAVIFPLEERQHEKLPDEDSLNQLNDRLNQIPRKDVFLVIADQFFYEPSHRELTRDWLSELKKENKGITIVETSIAPIDKYYESDSVTYTESFGAIRNIEKLPLKTKALVAEFVKNLCNEYFVEAQICDPNNRPLDYNLRSGFDKLISNACKLSELVGIEEKNVYKFIGRLQKLQSELDHVNDEKNYVQASILHTAFLVLFYSDAGRDISEYSLPLTRLKNYLGLSNELSD